jgi:hypothetical protein
MKRKRMLVLIKDASLSNKSSVEQDTIDCEYLAYFEPKTNSKKKLIKEMLCNFLVRTLQYLRKKYLKNVLL